MIRLINFASDNMTTAQIHCSQSAYKQGVNQVIEYTPSKISEEFKQFNHSVLTSARGAGYWLWKPYFIQRGLNHCDDGDILIYADSGVEFVNSVHHIIDRMDQSVFLFTNTHPNHHWTKRETLDVMMPEWVNYFRADTPWPQVQASVIFFKVNQETRDFVKRWLLWCQMPGIIDDVKGEQMSYFQDHRHDQSVISILATQAGYKLHWWPTQYSEHIRVPGDSYPVMFNHHRKRNEDY